MVQDIDAIVSIHRHQEMTETSANIVHQNRKRKYQGEKLKQPNSKHKCYSLVSTSDFESQDKNSQASSSSQSQLISQNNDFTSLSELDSTKDSNSLPAHSESITSSYGQAISEPECSHAYVYRHRHTMTGQYGYSFDGAADDHQLGYSNLEQDRLEFEMQGYYFASECENDAMEVGEDDDLDDLLYSDCSKVDPNKFVLSSGRWVISQDAHSTARKPTIDQEFEQYFSTLML